MLYILLAAVILLGAFQAFVFFQLVAYQSDVMEEIAQLRHQIGDKRACS